MLQKVRVKLAVASISILGPLEPRAMQICGDPDETMINWAISLSSFAIDVSSTLACPGLDALSDSSQYGQTVEVLSPKAPNIHTYLSFGTTVMIGSFRIAGQGACFP